MQVPVVSENCMKLVCSAVFLFASAFFFPVQLRAAAAQQPPNLNDED